MPTPAPRVDTTAPTQTSWWDNAKDSAAFILKRLLQRNLTQVASSLTFTTILAIVPLLAVILALFTAFPLFDDFREALQGFLTSNLMPEAVSENVMDYLNQFAAKASSLTAVGSLFLIVTSIMLISTIDETFNAIWLVSEQRPLAQRILVYWAIISLGPIVAGASIWASTVLARESLGYIGNLSVLASFALSAIPLALTALAFSALFVYVPNRKVLWRDAIIGGIATTFALEVLKQGFAFYLTQFPTYTLIYGAFATLPIFLMWMYLSWMVVLLGASLVAIMPNLRRRNWVSTKHAGASFVNALSLLQLLWQQRTPLPNGINVDEISNYLKRDPASLSSLLKSLKKMGFVVNTMENEDEKWVLACDPAITPLAPLVDAFLLDRHQADTPASTCMVKLIDATLANPSITLSTLFEKPDLFHQLSQQIQKNMLLPTQHQGVNYAQSQ